MIKILPVFALVIVCGCASTPEEVAPPAHVRTVRFESEPSGARVFIAYGISEAKAESESYLGQTPCEAKIPARENGEFEIKPHIAFASRFGNPPVAVIIARHGTNEVRKVYKKSAFGREGDLIPPALFFDFAKP